MVSSSEGITLLPFPLEGVMDVPRFNLEDGIHPTAAGMEIVAENIWRALRPYLLN
jgi:acyl-CoA thioesterase-1